MSKLSASAAAYSPSWSRAPAAPAAPARQVGSTPPVASPAAPPRMTVTRTTTNAMESVLPPPPPPPPTLGSFTTSYTAYGGLSRVVSTDLKPNPSPLMTPGGSPILSKRYPSRLSPAIAPAPSHHMNPNAPVFVPGKGFTVGDGMAGPAGGMDVLPTSTADLDAAQGKPGAATRSPAWRPSVLRRSAANSPALHPVRLDTKSTEEIIAISLRSKLKVDAPVFESRRTMNRVVLSRPSPLMLAQDPAQASVGMMLDDLWCLFYLPAHFGESIKEETYNPTLIFRVESIPTFWKVFNNVPTPSKMQLSTLYMFKDGIDPKWEDPANRDGGIVKVKVTADQVDEAWELLLCKTIGDSWTPSVRPTINGVALKVRERGYLLEVWVTRQTPELMRDLAMLWSDALGAAFAAAYYSHEAMQSKSAAAAAAAERKKKVQGHQRNRW